ncbi:MAG: preprotein translocase subunit SecA [Pseudomonadota bacterium]|nr:preprotein translocase subunit SecA [Pseudomonadota bacterium]
MNFFKKMLGSSNDREVKRLQQVVAKVNALEDQYRRKDDASLQQMTAVFKEKLANGAALTNILPDAFSVVREASRRVLEQRHYDVQLMGGIALLEGKIAEMKTGEGKTLTATLPLYLKALTGKGAHLVTVNDYLAKRDAEWMGQIYEFLQVSCRPIVHGLSDRQRHDAYHSDITYATNNELGFDYLRDNMKTNRKQMVQRDLHFAIVDEVDSILIDEARTPLIISGSAETTADLFLQTNKAIPELKDTIDYIVDEKAHAVSLTEDGINKVEKRLNVDNLYAPQHIDVLHHVMQSLKAHVLYKKDVDYVVKEGQVIIVDEHTGRLMPGRRYSEGLHGALEAKEHLPIQSETQTLATISFQNYFRMYDVLAGMTGTADTEAAEFKKIYKLDVVVLPTNQRMIRIDHEDMVYRTAREKFNQITTEIANAQKAGRPVLVGTQSVERSELVSKLLTKRKIPHEVLNAKNHAREAEIIKCAGERGSVTISTNMAGRGTDIVLGEGVADMGGLLVIGTERGESRRIDNQLRGRSGRQGDKGESKFFLSLEDDLMRIFASDRLSGIMARLGMTEGESIVSPMVSKAIARAQKKVEEQNFSSRKHLLEYDDVMNQQRQVVYSRRMSSLDNQSEVHEFFQETVQAICQNIANKHSPEALNSDQWDIEAIAKEIQADFNIPATVSLAVNAEELGAAGIAEVASEQVIAAYKEKMAAIEAGIVEQIEAHLYLQIIDAAWKDHLLAMDHLKDAVSLRGYAQRDPLQEYKKEAFNLFNNMWERIQTDTVHVLIRMPQPRLEMPPPQQEEEDAGIDDRQMTMHHPSPDQNQASEPPTQTFRRDSEKIGRNAMCPCGSGKKYKKCCGRQGAGAQL